MVFVLKLVVDTAFLNWYEMKFWFSDILPVFEIWVGLDVSDVSGTAHHIKYGWRVPLNGPILSSKSDQNHYLMRLKSTVGW